jgi:phospholipase/carboxylesterase
MFTLTKKFTPHNIFFQKNILINFKYFSIYSKMESKFKIEKSNQDIILTPTEGYDSVLIFMHGLGDSAMGYQDFFDSEYKPVPNRMKVVLLTAPRAAVTINGGMVMNSWYDIKNFQRGEDSYDESDVVKNSARIRKVIENEAKKLENNFSKVFIGGFSQGACMSLHVALTHEKKLGGLIALSGLLFPFTAKEIDNDETKKDLDIFIAHGSYDDVIPEPLAKITYKPLFEKEFKKLIYKSYDEAHSIAMEEIDDMKKFIKNLV